MICWSPFRPRTTRALAAALARLDELFATREVARRIG